MTDFKSYESMRRQGIDALSAYKTARNSGLNQLDGIKMLRTTYDLSLDDARKISFEGDTGEAYEAQQGKLVNEFTKILDDELGLD